MLIAEVNLPMEDLEANLRLDLFKNKVLKDKMQAAIDAVTEEAAKTYYESHLEEFTQTKGRLASHILVQVPEGADEAVKAERRAKAEGIRKALMAGADFAKLAGEVSDCPSRARGGALGVVPRGREAPAFEEAVYGQVLGAIGEVVESPLGYHIVRATGEQEEKVFTFDEVKERLVVLLKSQAQQKITAEYIQELKNKATIKLDGMLASASASAETEKAKAAEPEVPATAPAAEAPAPAAAP